MTLSAEEIETGGQVGAVVVGAFLATIGGYLASQIEHSARRRESERGAALLFAEVLWTLKLVLALALQARGKGDPYGPVTMRLVRAARREVDTYERNREGLFALSDPAVRARTHGLLVRLALTLDATLDAHEQADAAELTLAGKPPSDPLTQLLAARLGRLTEERQRSFDYAMELATEIEPLLAPLRATAHYAFQDHERVARADLYDALGAPGGRA